MGKILVGRDNPQEVEVGFTLASVSPSVEEKENNEVSDAEKEEELVEAAVEDVQVDAVEESGAPVEEKAVAKRRGKKGRKA